MNEYIKIDSDDWSDSNKIWFVLEYRTRENSTAVELTLKDSFGKIENRVVASHQIEWLGEKDW